MAYDASKPPDGGSLVAADVRENFRALKEDEIVVPSIKSAFDVLNALDKLWIYQNTAPAGWNIVAGTTDALLACKGGSQAYNAAGGTQVGTWTQPNHTHGAGSYAGPSHVHPYTVPYSGYSYQNNHVSGWNVIGRAAGTSGITGCQNANRSLTTSAGGTGAITGISANGATAATYRPLANLGIIIEKI